MGIAPGQGVSASGLPPAGDLANAVISGTFTGVGPGKPFAFRGPMNLNLWASSTTALTTTQGSNAASVASGTGIAAGTAVNSVNVPPGTTWATFSGTAGTLALPIITLQGDVNASSATMRGMRTTTGLLGATVRGPGFPAAGVTVTSIITPAAVGTITDPVQNVGAGDVSQFGVIGLSAAPSASTQFKTPALYEFTLTNQAITTGVDAAAVFTGAGITWSGTVQLERCFDGATWLLANVGGTGSLAQYTAGTPVSLTFGEPEREVLYRWNCTAYTSGVINYRMSETGGAATSLDVGSLI